MRNTTWAKIFQDAKDIYGRDLDEKTMVRRANRLLDDLRLIDNLPTQIRVGIIPYAYEFEKYKLPSDYKTEGQIDLRYNDRLDQGINFRNYSFVEEERPYQRLNTSWNWLNPDEWNERIRVDSASIQADKGVEKLLLSNGRADQTNQVISDCDSLTGWVGSGGAGNLTLDDNIKAEGSYSINYDLTSATTAILTLTGDSIDLSEYLERGIIRLFKWLPTAPTSIQIRIGSSASDYYYQTISKQADGSDFDTIRRNELEINFAKRNDDDTEGEDYMATSGTPDMSAVIHFQFRMTFASATTDTDFRIDDIRAWKPTQLELEYYSYFMAKTTAGVWQSELTEEAGNSEIINILPEWRKPFVRGLLIEELDKASDKRVGTYEKFYDNWLLKIAQKYQNRKKKIGNNWF